MREMIMANWRTTLLAVSILIGLLMFTQGKISASEFLAILGFFNVAGYLLTKDARSAEHRALVEQLEREEQATANRRTRRQQRRYELMQEVLYRLVVAFIVTVVLLCFYPLLQDALSPDARHYQPGTMYTAPSYPVAPSSGGGASLPADDMPPGGPPTGPGSH